MLGFVRSILFWRMAHQGIWRRCCVFCISLARSVLCLCCACLTARLHWSRSWCCWFSCRCSCSVGTLLLALIIFRVQQTPCNRWNRSGGNHGVVAQANACQRLVRYLGFEHCRNDLPKSLVPTLFHKRKPAFKQHVQDAICGSGKTLEVIRSHLRRDFITRGGPHEVDAAVDVPDACAELVDLPNAFFDEAAHDVHEVALNWNAKLITSHGDPHGLQITLGTRRVSAQHQVVQGICCARVATEGFHQPHH